MNISHFGGHPDGTDTTLAVRKALESLRGQKNARLTFSPGRYEFWGDRAAEKYLFVANNDDSLKRLIFPVFDFENLEIDGQGAEFVFHGFVSPFAILGCQGVKLSNFSIDWTRTFHSETQVLDVGEGWADLYIPEAFPFIVEHERLIFTGEKADRYQITNALEFEPHLRETAFRVWDNYEIGNWHRVELIGPRCVRLYTDYSSLPTAGNTLVLIDDQRRCPAIIIQESQNVELENVTIHHCGGMGVIAQNSRDLRLENVQIVPPAGRLISTTADATHFVNCGGQITVENCRFENQLDDPLNIHGIYTPITMRVADNEIEVRLAHKQQIGLPVAQVGDEVGFICQSTLQMVASGIVSDVEVLNKNLVRLKFAESLPSEIGEGYVVENHEWHPEVTIRDCVSRGNRARGFLLSSGGKVLVENNTFHNPGAAILIAGDANHWFESGAVNDVTIRGNTFDNCLYGVWGRAVIDINPEIEPEFQAESAYHRNIYIENNHFRIFDSRLLRAQCVDGLYIFSNTIEINSDYPLQPLKSELFETAHCHDVLVENNTTLSLSTSCAN